MLGERVFGRPKSRAERVRSRKSRRTKKMPKDLAIDRGQRRRSARSRRGTYGTAVSTRGRKLPGIAHLILALGSRWISLFALGASVWMIMVLKTSMDFQVQTIGIEGAYYMGPSRIRSIAGIAGKQSFQVDPSLIERNLESHPEILSAQVTVQWPNLVNIEIEERHPILEWNDGGTSWLISSDAIAFLRRNSPPELNRVHSLESVLEIEAPLDPVIAPEVIQAALQLKALVGDEQDLFYDPRHGFGFQDFRGWMAYFGTEGDMELKLEAYANIVEILLQNRYPASFVSIENISAAYYR